MATHIGCLGMMSKLWFRQAFAGPCTLANRPSSFEIMVKLVQLASMEPKQSCFCARF